MYRYKKILSIGLVMIMIFCVKTATVFADSNAAGIVTLDSTGGDIVAGTLQARVEATGIVDATEVIELHIGSDVSGDFDAVDITYINDMVNIEVLDVASTIIVGDVGEDFCINFEHLVEVTFPATTFGNNAFRNCALLATINLPKATTFGNRAFNDCGALTTVSLPEATTFEDFAFSYCDVLTTVSLPEATTFRESAFYFCDALTTVSLPKATTFEDFAFYNCDVLETISLPEATTFRHNAFYSCDALATISLPKATTFGNFAFRYCAVLATINLPKATTFGYSVFNDCGALTIVSLPEATTFGDDLFFNCTNLTTLTFGETVPTIEGWGPGFTPGTLYVPQEALNTYDPDDDGLWEGWRIVINLSVAFDSQGGTVVSNQIVEKDDKAIKPSDPTRSGYTFGGWYTTSACNLDEAWNFSLCAVTGDTTLYAKWEAIPSEPTVITVTETNTQTVTVTVNEYTTQVPENYIGSNMIFEAESGSATVSINGLSLSQFRGHKVEVFIQKISPSYFDLDTSGRFPVGMMVYDISLIVDGIKVPFTTYRSLEITFELDGNYDPNKMVPIYIKQNGTYEILEGICDGSTMCFTSNHLSNFSVLYNDVAFNDVSGHWGQEAIEALAAREIVNGIGNELFNPEGEISRAEYVTMMVRYFDMTAYGTDLGFVDITDGDWYSEYVWIARENGILPDIYGNLFQPEEAISREEMMYILYKSLEITNRLDNYLDQGDRLLDFIDGEMVAAYARTSSDYLISRDIINGNGNGSINPCNTSSRAEVAQMLYNLLVN